VPTETHLTMGRVGQTHDLLLYISVQAIDKHKVVPQQATCLHFATLPTGAKINPTGVCPIRQPRGKRNATLLNERVVCVHGDLKAQS